MAHQQIPTGRCTFTRGAARTINVIIYVLHTTPTVYAISGCHIQEIFLLERCSIKRVVHSLFARGCVRMLVHAEHMHTDNICTRVRYSCRGKSIFNQLSFSRSARLSDGASINHINKQTHTEKYEAQITPTKKKHTEQLDKQTTHLDRSAETLAQMSRNAHRVAVTETHFSAQQILVERVRKEIDSLIIVEDGLLQL